MKQPPQATFASHEEVILVNERDEVLGVEEKLTAHSTGALHRAFSIFIVNSAGDMLLQKRASTKYHSKGLWSNACCGHPRLGETTEAASRRRLLEEMGFDCDLAELFQFVYRVKLDNGLSEHELDHVMVGKWDGNPNPSPAEVDDWKWMAPAALHLDVKQTPKNYTYWFRISLDKVLQGLGILT
jgi:isopentenyl-diphosphate delta-isomerase